MHTDPHPPSADTGAYSNARTPAQTYLRTHMHMCTVWGPRTHSYPYSCSQSLVRHIHVDTLMRTHPHMCMHTEANTSTHHTSHLLICATYPHAHQCTRGTHSRLGICIQAKTFARILYSHTHKKKKNRQITMHTANVHTQTRIYNMHTRTHTCKSCR